MTDFAINPAASGMLQSQGKAETAKVDQLGKRLQHGAANMNKREIIEKSKEFEGVFIAQMLKPMFQTVETDPMFGGGHAESIYRDMMVKELGNKIANEGGFGIAEQLQSKLFALQEVQQ